MILFYDRSQRSGAVASVGPQGLSTSAVHESGSFSGWTHVVRQGDRLVFHDARARSAAVALLRSDGVVTTHVHKAGSLDSWTHLVACSDGVFFYNRYNGAASFATVGDRLTTTQSWEPGQFANWTHVTSAGESSDVLLFTNRFSGAGAVGRITQKAFTTTVSYERGHFDEATHVVSCGSTVLFTNRDTGGAVIGTLTATGLTRRKTHGAGYFGRWSHLATDGDRVVFYDRESASAATGRLTASGYTAGPAHRDGSLARWSNLAGSSACGPERDELLLKVLPVHWPATPSPTLPDREWLRRYFFDLSNPDGIGRFWLKSSGGNLRFVGEVADWIPMDQQPMITSQASIGQQIEAAYAAGKAIGWAPGRADAVVVVSAAPGAGGVAGGASSGTSFDNSTMPGVILHGDPQEFVDSGNNPNNTDVRFDFNAHEVGHLVGYSFGFNHAFGPAGAYDNGYCVMAAGSYGSVPVAYDLWSTGSKRSPWTHGRGPGLSGCTRAALGWARTWAMSADEFRSGTMVTMAHLGDEETVLTQVAEVTVPGSGVTARTYTVEMRSPLAESDQGYRACLVVSQRQDPLWSEMSDFGSLSATFVDSLNLGGGSSVDSLNIPGVLHLQVYEVGPIESVDGLRGPAWVRLRIGAKAPLLKVDPNLPVKGNAVWPDRFPLPDLKI